MSNCLCASVLAAQRLPVASVPLHSDDVSVVGVVDEVRTFVLRLFCIAFNPHSRRLQSKSILGLGIAQARRLSTRRAQ
jgi:hypothetical protein